MIETITPLRVSLFGGGSDLPAYYTRHTGAVLSVSIGVYVRVRWRATPSGVRLVMNGRYHEAETADTLDEPLVRACLLRSGITDGVELTVSSDVPMGTGLGSSSALAVGLLQGAAYFREKSPIAATDLAKAACSVEIDDLDGALGKQDQFAVAHGGCNLLEFLADDGVRLTPVTTGLDELPQRWLLLDTGLRRRAQTVLLDHRRRLLDGVALAAQTRLVELAYRGLDCLRAREWDELAALLDRGWQEKRSLSPFTSLSCIDALYERARGAGASGGKLLGAGAGGFLLVVCPPERRSALRAALADVPSFIPEIDFLGSRLLHEPVPTKQLARAASASPRGATMAPSTPGEAYEKEERGERPGTPASAQADPLGAGDERGRRSSPGVGL